MEEFQTKLKNLKPCQTISEPCDDILIPSTELPFVDFMDIQNSGFQFDFENSHTMNFIKSLTDTKIIEYFKAQNWTENSPLHLVYITRHDETLSLGFKKLHFQINLRTA